MIAIQTINLKKSFKKILVLKGISLTINKGEIFGLVGPDGAGKTTFIRTILGLYLPDSGQTSLLETTDPEDTKSKIGYVPQQFSLNTDMTVWENISLFAELQNMKRYIFKERADKLLSMVWLNDFKERLASDLSGGMKRKLALVCSTIHNPELLILDEPTTGVDPISRREFWQMLYRLNRDGMTILVSTPYMDEVELCNRLAFFHQGEVCALGSPTELLEQYPNKLFSVQSTNLRAILGRIKDLPAKNIYLQGEELHFSLLDENHDMPILEQTLQQIGLSEFIIAPIKPTLEDLFSVLSVEEALL